MCVSSLVPPPREADHVPLKNGSSFPILWTQTAGHSRGWQWLWLHQEGLAMCDNAFLSWWNLLLVPNSPNPFGGWHTAYFTDVPSCSYQPKNTIKMLTRLIQQHFMDIHLYWPCQAIITSLFYASIFSIVSLLLCHIYIMAQQLERSK